MSAPPQRHTIQPEPGFRSREVALAVAQLEELTRRLVADTEDLAPEALEWQVAPGANTIGMLLAHVAHWEVWWVRAILEGRAGAIDVRDVLGVGREEIGIPLPPGGRPPAAFEGRDVAYFHDLLTRARAHTYLVARSVADEELDRELARTRANGTQQIQLLKKLLAARR